MTSTVPPFSGKRLLYVITGSIGAMFAPMWASWLTQSYPETQLRILVTRSALNFFGTTALSAVTKADVITDEWPDQPSSALHVELAAWPDSVIIHPASFSFISRLALGLADTPLMLALQCTTAPIAVAPGLPPGGDTSEAFASHTEALSRRRNIAVLPTRTGISASTGEIGGGTVVQMPVVISALEKLRMNNGVSVNG